MSIHAERDLRWRTTAVAVGAFRADRGRWPAMDVPDAEERRLGIWLNNQRAAARGGKSATALTVDRRTHLDDVAPGWLPSATPRGPAPDWFARARAVGAFRAEHGRWPLDGSKDAEERQLAAWLRNRRSAARGGRNAAAMTSQRRAYLDEVAPGWLPEHRPANR